MKSNITATRLWAVLICAVTLFFCAPVAHAETPPPEPPPNGEQTPAPGAKAPGEKPAARREDVEPKTLTEAQTALKAARADRDKAEADLVTAQAAAVTAAAALAKANTNCDTALAASVRLQTELTTANASITTITGERDTARTSLTTAGENITRLEALARVQGINPAAAVGNKPETSGLSKRDELLAAFREEKSPDKRAEIAAQMRELDTHGTK